MQPLPSAGDPVVGHRDFRIAERLERSPDGHPQRGGDVLLELFVRDEWQLALRAERRQDVVLERERVGGHRLRFPRVALLARLLRELRQILLPSLQRIDDDLVVVR
jgi:hypothetical protein